MGSIENNGSTEVENKCHGLFPGCRGKVQWLLTQIIWEWRYKKECQPQNFRYSQGRNHGDGSNNQRYAWANLLDFVPKRIYLPCSRKRLWKAFLLLLGVLPSGAVVCKAVQGSGVHILRVRGGALEEKCIADREYKFSVAFLERSRLVVSCYL